jgi:hypothetical protein
MRLPSHYQRGDRVAIVSCEELEEMLQIYGDDDLTPEEVASIGSCIGTLLWLPSESEIDGWDGRVPVKFNSHRTYNLPFAAIVEIPEGFSFVEEPDDEEVKVIRDKASEGNLVMHMAAETIQSNYRYSNFIYICSRLILSNGVDDTENADLRLSSAVCHPRRS